MSKKRLGRGLEALIPARVVDAGDQIRHVPVDQIQPDPDQPRQHFDAKSLAELAASIMTHGVIQPLTVAPKGSGYQIIAGERRYQASKLARLGTVPVIVRDFKKQHKLEISLVENVQRQDLRPVEEARAYKRLMDEFNLPQKTIAARVGKGVPTISNKIRLLTLPTAVLDGLTQGKITEGHARALLSLENSDRILIAYGQILRDKLSVRAVESLVKSAVLDRRSRPRSNKTGARWQDQERRLQNRLGTRVQIRESSGKGEIRISFFSTEELERLLKFL